MVFEYDLTEIEKVRYLTNDVYANILRNALKIRSPQIIKINCSMGSSTGENYCSQIYRSRIQYKNGNSGLSSLSVIIKSMPKTEEAKFLELLRVFFKEKTIYNDILPHLEDLMSVKFGPSLAEPVNTLVFEDLNGLDFKMAARETGLDEKHARLTLKRLAQFHASSMVLAKKNSAFTNDFDTGMLAAAGLADDDGILMRFFGGCAGALIELVEKWPGYEKITQKIRSYVTDLRKNLISSQARSPNETFRVFNHGDLWVNNMLFKYDSTGKEPSDVVFVDYQMSVWGSPGIDLNYFFFSSLQLELLQHKRIILLEHYHKELCAALGRMKHADLSPTLEEVKMEFKNRAAYGFFASYVVFPTTSMDKKISNDSSLENFLDEDFARKKFRDMFRSKRVEETLRYTLKEFDELNVWN